MPPDSSSVPSDADACPVDHSARSAWLAGRQAAPEALGASHPLRSLRPPERTRAPRSADTLPTDRETSSIPRLLDDPEQPATKWVYPSQRQFHAALERKGHKAHRVEDMDSIVPIHNAVNERTWAQVLDWERRALGPEAEARIEDSVKLVSFKGRPKELSPRAWFRSLVGCVNAHTSEADGTATSRPSIGTTG